MSAMAQHGTSAAESLSAALERVYRKLVQAAASASPAQAEPPATTDASPWQGADQPCLALQRLKTLFGLSAFEQDVLLLCLGASVEARFLPACAAIHGSQQTPWPTFGLALSVLDDAHWSAISRTRPLRYWRLIEVASSSASNGSLLHAPLQLDERILQLLLGVPAMDERLEAVVRPLPEPPERGRHRLSGPLDRVLDAGMRHWTQTTHFNKPILLCGDGEATREAAFAELCHRTTLQPYLFNTADLPGTPEDRERLARLWTREAALQQAALYVRCTDSDSVTQLSSWLASIQAPIAVDVPSGSPAERIDGLRLDVPGLSATERKTAWLEQLGDAAPRLNGTLDRIVEYFHFDAPAIRFAATTTLQTPVPGDEDLGGVAWRVCRQHGRRSLDNLARRIESRASWSQLVLPEAQIETLRQIAIHMRQRAVVNHQWGFSERYSRGHGLSALFAGPSGTGKTMAAEILARELDLDLYQIDLASLVSKYIGETEKNLRRIFDVAEESGAVLLFDEADALFGKRSEVRDSHDRYANLEVSYLLQRMDSYRGVAILTTNMRHALDSAFLRRIRFIVSFPFPDAPSRARIWQDIFPGAAPVGALDFELLSQLNVPGGVIRNIATHAAFLAAEQATAIEPQHVLAAARIEYSKMDKPLTASETRGWS
ncbi:ATP-binding protein [Dyella subtropica]|uniref:ATP-binding protein n=1 Tax=Dyella subtropica TaxID=2992127 RepID=UPI002256268C|nr:ATP-binding protein [Dyella subtropica]